jgi:hypothetical protein
MDNTLDVSGLQGDRMSSASGRGLTSRASILHASRDRDKTKPAGTEGPAGFDVLR